MLFYVLLFFTTTALFFVAGKSHGALHVVLTAFALLVPCVIAACRDTTVGTDLSRYGSRDFNSVSVHGFADGLSVLLDSQQPFGYSLLTSADIMIFHSLPVHLFILQALTIVPIYMATRRFAGKEYTWIGMIWYMTMLYPSSLNIMKQMIAVAFLTLAVEPIVKGRKIEFLLWVLVACSFHQTAVLFIAMYPLCRIILTNKRLQFEETFEATADPSEKYRGLWFRSGLLMAVTVAFMVIIGFGDMILTKVATLKGSYKYSIEHAGENGISTNHIILLLILVVIGLAFYFETFINDAAKADSSSDVADHESLGCRRRLDYMFFTLTFVGVLLEQSMVITENFYRFTYYGLAFGGIYFARKAVEQRSWKLQYQYLFWVLSLIMVCAQLMLFYKTAVVAGGDSIVPYTSEILGIGV